MPLSYLFTISLFITPILSPNCSQPPHPLTGDVVGRRLGVEEVEFGRRLWLSICPLRFPQWCGFVGGHCFFFFPLRSMDFKGRGWVCVDLVVIAWIWWGVRLLIGDFAVGNLNFCPDLLGTRYAYSRFTFIYLYTYIFLCFV